MLGIFALDGAGTTLAAGGDFTKVSGNDQQGFAEFTGNSSDATNPTVTAPPKLIVQLGATLGTTAVPTRVSFAATDASGICAYDVQQSVGGDPYQP